MKYLCGAVNLVYFYYMGRRQKLFCMYGTVRGRCVELQGDNGMNGKRGGWACGAGRDELDPYNSYSIIEYVPIALYFW